IGARARIVSKDLRKAVRDRVPEVRSAALIALGQIPDLDWDPIPLFVKGLKDRNVATRRASVLALAEASVGAEAVTGLSGALDDGDAAVRRAASKALGSIGEEAAAAVPRLLALLDDGDESVRAAAVEAFGRLGDAAEPAIFRLVCLAESTSDETLKTQAFASLAQIARGDVDTICMLETSLRREKSDALRLSATQALVAVVRDPLYLTTILTVRAADSNSDVRRVAVEGLGEIGREAQEALPVLFRMLDDRYQRAMAFRALSKIEPRDVTLLTKALNHRERFVRSFASEQLGRLRSRARSALPKLRDLAESDDDRRVRENARRAVRRIEGRR
ncbi:MAG: HEAT repeat domain-containing protein, partial [Planctomycetota bacterium]